jgi:hypothetical protein
VVIVLHVVLLILQPPANISKTELLEDWRACPTMCMEGLMKQELIGARDIVQSWRERGSEASRTDDHTSSTWDFADICVGVGSNNGVVVSTSPKV